MRKRTSFMRSKEENQFHQKWGRQPESAIVVFFLNNVQAFVFSTSTNIIQSLWLTQPNGLYNIPDLAHVTCPTTSTLSLRKGVYKLDLTLPMLKLYSPKAQRCKNLWKTSKPCHVGTHWKALAEYSQMSTHMPGFRWFFRVFCILFWQN